MAAITAPQHFLSLFLPTGLFDALEAGTRTFMLECPCGEKRDLWEAGGAKGGGTRQRTLSNCRACGKLTWHHKRKKTADERREDVLAMREDVVLLSAHAVWASVIAWGSAALLWSCPMFLIRAPFDPVEFAGLWLASFVIGWLGPYFWATTRYRVGRTELELASGFFSKTLELREIGQVVRKREGIGTSFAFHTDALWLAERSGRGYLVSPRDRALFLELLDQRCAHLVLQDGELVPAS